MRREDTCPSSLFRQKASYQSEVTEFLLPFPSDIKGMSKDQYQVMLELQQQIWDGGGIPDAEEAD